MISYWEVTLVTFVIFFTLHNIVYSWDNTIENTANSDSEQHEENRVSSY